MTTTTRPSLREITQYGAGVCALACTAAAASLYENCDDKDSMCSTAQRIVPIAVVTSAAATAIMTYLNPGNVPAKVKKIMNHYGVEILQEPLKPNKNGEKAGLLEANFSHINGEELEASPVNPSYKNMLYSLRPRGIESSTGMASRTPQPKRSWSVFGLGALSFLGPAAVLTSTLACQSFTIAVTALSTIAMTCSFACGSAKWWGDRKVRQLDEVVRKRLCNEIDNDKIALLPPNHNQLERVIMDNMEENLGDSVTSFERLKNLLYSSQIMDKNRDVKNASNIGSRPSTPVAQAAQAVQSVQGGK